MSCVNGGTVDNDCTSCACSDGWTGTTCNTCALEHCIKCSGSPASCDECIDGYTVMGELCPYRYMYIHSLYCYTLNFEDNIITKAHI